MKVSKKSRNYRMWKWYHGKDAEPKNLCRYFWSCLAQWGIYPLLEAVLVLIVFAVSLVVWFFGFRCNLLLAIFKPEKAKELRSEEGFDLAMKYKTDLYNWTRRNRRYKVAPWQVASVFLGIWHFTPIIGTLSLIATEASAMAKDLGNAIMHYWEGELITISIIAALVVFVYIMCRQETREYLRAKKQRWCPEIEITD